MKIRWIRPDDATAYRSILERTSDDDRYNRFFHLVDALDPADVQRSVEQRADMLGAIAFDEAGLALGAGHAALLAIGRPNSRSSSPPMPAGAGSASNSCSPS